MRKAILIFLALVGLRAAVFIIATLGPPIYHWLTVTVPRFYEKDPVTAAVLTLAGLIVIGAGWICYEVGYDTSYY